jgi:hypothetical protein
MPPELLFKIVSALYPAGFVAHLKLGRYPYSSPLPRGFTFYLDNPFPRFLLFLAS